MKFRSITIENFGSFGDEQRLKLDHRGLVLVEGVNRDDPSATSNGSGKSTLFEALVWCLFGKTIKGVSDDAVVNRFVGNNCAVSLTFTDDGGSEYEVTRYRKHIKFKNNLELMVGLHRHTGVSIAETQEKIEKVIGLDYNTLVGVLCGQGVMKPFSTMTDKQMKDVLEQIVGLEVYENARLAANTKVKEAQEALEDAQRDHSTVEQEIANLGLDITVLEEAEQTELKEKEESLAQIDVELRRVNTKALAIPRLRDVMDKAEAALKETSRAERDATAEVVRTLRAIEAGDDRVNDLSAHLKTKEHGVVCEECGGPFDAANVRKLIAKEHKKIITAQLEKGLARDAESNAKKAHIEAQDAYDSARSEWAKTVPLSATAAALVKDRERVERDIEKLKKGGKADLLKTKRQRLAGKNAELEVIEERLSTVSENFEYLEFWLAGFSNKGLKSLVLDSVLPFLNTKARRYSEILTDGSINVEFKTQTDLKSGASTDRFSVEVTTRTGAESYAGNSGGEKRKVDIIVGLSLQALLASRSKSKPNVIFFDEPFESLDPEGFDRVLTLLTEELDYESVFVITHRPELQDYFSTVVRVVKNNGFTAIEK